ncbi:MAG: SDR family NAD(P)-dependent oxidoreductase [Anaerolineae bacterium]|nr:SDR family NAD(P)-dependent oxidoreductase [Anaerolineae bacterium]
MDARGKIALVTGGAVRVGRALTLALAQSGADVFINYRSSAAEADAVVQEARAYGVRAWPIRADLSDPEAIARLVQIVEEIAGGVDVLVNSASPFICARLADTTLEVWRTVLGALLDGPFLLCRAFAPGMVERGSGLIVNVLDQSAFRPAPAYFAHTIGKTSASTDKNLGIVV